ncbi:hypothetical protein SB758_42905, partial [Burkholderia sp. SIMBA_013]
WQGSGYALLLSHGGNVVSSPVKDEAGKPWKGEKEGFTSKVVQRFDAVLGEDALVTWQPVVIGNSEKPWYLGVVAPV